MAAEKGEVILKNLNRVAKAFEHIEAPGRSSIDTKAANMAHKISKMVESIGELFRLSLCLADKCEAGGKICRSPQGRLRVLLLPNQISVIRSTDIKVLAFHTDNEWHASFMIGGQGSQRIFAVHEGGVRICLESGEKSRTCLDIPPDTSYIRDNYSDVRLYAGKVDPALSRVLEGLRQLARRVSPGCLKA